MSSEDQCFITGSSMLFCSDEPLALRFGDAVAKVQAAVDAVDDVAVLAADAPEWSRRLGVDHRVRPPSVEIAAAVLEYQGQIAVDGADQFVLSDFPAGRDRHRSRGRRLSVSIPVTGELELLASRPSAGAAPVSADLEDGCVRRRWVWPESYGAAAFSREAEAFKAAVAEGVEGIAADVEQFNESLPDIAGNAIEDRRRAIRSEREFLESLPIPITRNHSTAPSAWRRVLARVAGWPAPPRNLLLSALVLLVFPWDDVLIDAIYSGDPRSQR
jgi:hypothetical protein